MGDSSIPGLATRDAAIHADAAEALAFVDLYAAAPADLQARLGLRTERVADATLLIAPGLPSPMFNRVIGLGLRQPASADTVLAIMEKYRAAGCANWWLHWNPCSVPAHLPSTLSTLGFTQPARRSWAKVLRGPQASPRIPTDLGVGLATDAQLEAAVQAVVASFEMPPFMGDWLRALHGRERWKVYAITDGQEVVGGGNLFVSDSLAWLGMGAVLPSHRRRGGQGALMAKRVDDAIASGAQYIATETGEPLGDEPNPSLANMKRCGFETVASRLNFAAPA